MRRFTWLSGAALLVLIGFGCGGGPCGDAEDRTVVADDTPCAMMVGDAWESHPLPPITDPECFWLEFRGCSTYRFENPLGRKPTDVIGLISFDRDGVFATPGSGNAFVIQEATDTEVTVRNAQNQLFFLRLVLR